MVDPSHLEDLAPESSSSEADEMLRQGIEAAQSGDRAEARNFLLSVTDSDPDNESAWLWLASISEYPEELLVFLNNVLRVNPGNERALEWAASTRALLGRNFVVRGSEAAEGGDEAAAKQYFMQAIVHDDHNESAWLWLASLAESDAEKRSHLGRVLRINPDNENALSQMEEFRAADTKAKLMDANRLAIAGGREEAQSILAEVLEDAPDLEDAWMLKAHLAESFDDKIECFERVLDLNEDNQVARANLESLRMIVGNAPDSVEEAVEASADADSEMTDSEFDGSNGEWAGDESEPAEELSFVEEAVSVGSMNEEAVEEAPEFEEEQVEFDSVEMELEPFEEVEEEVSEPDFGVGEEEEVSAEAEEDFSEVSEPDLEPIEQPQTSFGYETNLDISVNGDESEEETRDFVPVEDDEFLGSEPVENAPDACPFCDSDLGHQAFLCQSCNAVLTLSDLEMLISNESVDSAVVEGVVKKIEADQSVRGVVPEELMSLGIGYINLKQYRKGFEYLQEYAAKNPSDVVVSSQVDALAVRVAELEKQATDKEAQPTSKTILVVDDSPTIRKLISLKLQKCGHETVCAVDGVDALEKINDVVPDLVLLDITMPRMDGYQVCKLIRGNEATKDVPVVMISGKDGFFDKVRGKMVGTSDYITKPFGPETLMRTVNEYLM